MNNMGGEDDLAELDGGPEEVRNFLLFLKLYF